MEHLDKINEHEVIRYVTGGVPFWLFRKIAITHNISYGNLAAYRINYKSDHWAIVIRIGAGIKSFEDEPLLN